MKTDPKEHEVDPHETVKIKFAEMPTFTEESQTALNRWGSFKFTAKSYRFCAGKWVNFKLGTKFSEESTCFSNCLNANKVALELFNKEKASFILALQDIEARGKDINEEFQI